MTTTISGSTGVVADTLQSTGTGALTVPAGTTAQRPASPAVGMQRWNTTTSQLEEWNGSAWGSIVNTTDSAIVTPTMLTQPSTLATAQAATSGTSLTFSSIPNWAKKVTVMFSGVSTSGSSNKLVRIGSGSVATTGYVSTGQNYNSSVGGSTASSTAGFIICSGAGADTLSGSMTINLISTNNYIADHVMKLNTTYVAFGGGNVTLSGVMDRVVITTVNGTDTFAAGSVNIIYE
jgi:hypothetical protein